MLKEKSKLQKFIVSNNSVITTILLKLGIFEGSDAAWEDSDTWMAWEALRREFEIDQRFKDLSLKLEIIRDNTKFCLEMMHNQKASQLEWTIIILIAVEIVIGLLGLSK